MKTQSQADKELDMGVSQQYWNDAYRDGVFLSQWDYDFPSQELVGALSVLQLPTGSVALDLGCGGGRDAIYLAQNGFIVTGIDVSSAAIEVATRRAQESGASVTWLVGDVLDLPFTNQAFDLVTDRACFHHIADSDRPGYVQEVSKILKPGGFLVIRGSSYSRDDSFYGVTEKSIRTLFSDSDFVLGKLFSIKLVNNAGGLAANMVTLRRK